MELANKRAPLIERKRKRTDVEEAAGTAGKTAGEDETKTKADAKDAKSEPARGRQAARATKPEAAADAADQEAGVVPAGKGTKAGAGAKPPKPAREQAVAAVAAAGGAVGGGASSQKHAHMRTLAIGGLTPETTQQAIALARKAGEVRGV